MARAAKKTSAKTPSRKKASAGSKVSVKAAEQPTAKSAAGVPRSLGDVERALEDLMQRSWRHPSRWDWSHWGELPASLMQHAPSVDIVDRGKEVVVRAEVPGIEKDDLDVSVVERMLTIKGSSRKEEKEEKENYFRQEIRSGVFSRSMLLPADVNAAKASAVFKDGVLELHLPKVRASKRQKVEIP